MSEAAPWVRDEPRDAAECLALLEALNALPRLYRAGYLLDMLLAALGFDAMWLRTLSYVTAREDTCGARWACLGCRVLTVIEPDHCGKTLGVGDTARSVMARAGTLFVLGGLALAGVLHLLIWLAVAALRPLF